MAPEWGVALQGGRWDSIAGWRGGQLPILTTPYLATGITSQGATKQDLQVPLGSLEALHFESCLTFYISRGHSERANMEQIRNFSGFSHVLVQCTKISFHMGGVCVCFSKSVRKGRFRNVWVGGG